MNFICDKNHKHVDRFGCFTDWKSRLERLERENAALRAQGGITGSVLYVKFCIGQQVWRGYSRFEGKQDVPCRACAATGRVKLVGLDETTQCPKCYGTRFFWGPYKFVGYVELLTVGMVTASVYVPHSGNRKGTSQVEYMTKEHGIGSGYVFNENDLFATESEALIEANIRAVVEQIKFEETHVFDETIHAWREKDRR